MNFCFDLAFIGIVSGSLRVCLHWVLWSFVAILLDKVSDVLRVGFGEGRIICRTRDIPVKAQFRGQRRVQQITIAIDSTVDSPLETPAEKQSVHCSIHATCCIDRKDIVPAACVRHIELLRGARLMH